MCIIIGLTLASIGQIHDDEVLRAYRQEFIRIQPGLEPFPPARLPASFEVSKYEVTQNVWELVMGANPSRWRGERNSVELVSFDDAREFCRRLTTRLRMSGLIDPRQLVRLPTEAEWEYVARAGTTSAYSFGDDPAQLNAYAWYHGNAAGNDPPVGAKQPNPWGLYDIHGYLWEWCDNPQNAVVAADVDEVIGVVRGGSWKDSPEKLTSGYRRTVPRRLKDDAIGLRCVIVSQSAVPAEP